MQWTLRRNISKQKYPTYSWNFSVYPNKTKRKRSKFDQRSHSANNPNWEPRPAYVSQNINHTVYPAHVAGSCQSSCGTAGCTSLWRSCPRRRCPGLGDRFGASESKPGVIIALLLLRKNTFSKRHNRLTRWRVVSSISNSQNAPVATLLLQKLSLQSAFQAPS